jgi:hypothetical protein
MSANKINLPIIYHRIQDHPQKRQNLGNFIKNVGMWEKLPKCRRNVGEMCKMWEMWECGRSVQPDVGPPGVQHIPSCDLYDSPKNYSQHGNCPVIYLNTYNAWPYIYIYISIFVYPIVDTTLRSLILLTFLHCSLVFSTKVNPSSWHYPE